MKLTAARCRNAPHTGKVHKLHDGHHGLFLRVGAVKGKCWQQRVSIHGKRTDIGLGPFDLVTLSEARNKALANRKALLDGYDPRRVMGMRLEDASERVLEERRPTVKPKTHMDKVRRIEQHVLPRLGRMPVGDVDAAHIREVLLAINHAAALRKNVAHDISTILDWAVVNGHRNLPNPVEPVIATLPPPGNGVDKKGTGHRKAVPWEDAPAALRAVLETNWSANAKLALRFMVLTATRPGEVLGAEWREIDLDKAVWHIPGERMKTGRDHRIPLSPQALAVLREVKRRGPLCFPGRNGRSLAKSTFNRMHADAGIIGYSDPGDTSTKGIADPHGWRSTFADYLMSNGVCTNEVKEAALAHEVKNPSV